MSYWSQPSFQSTHIHISETIPVIGSGVGVLKRQSRYKYLWRQPQNSLLQSASVSLQRTPCSSRTAERRVATLPSLGLFSAAV